MIGTERLGLNLQRATEQRCSVVVAAFIAVESSQPFQYPSNFGRFLPQCLLVDLQSTNKHWLGDRIFSLVNIGLGEIGNVLRDFRAIVAQHFHINRENLAVKLLGLGILCLLIENDCEVAEIDGEFPATVVWGLLVDREHPPIKWFGLRGLSFVLVERCQVADGHTQARVVRLENLFADHHRLLRILFGIGIAACLAIKVAEIPCNGCNLAVVLAVCCFKNIQRTSKCGFSISKFFLMFQQKPQPIQR